jgi:hypothetical protein
MLFREINTVFSKNHTKHKYTLSADGRVKVKVTLRLEVYRKSVSLGVKHLETHDQSFFSAELFR